MLNGYMLIFWNAEGVHGQKKVGNPWLLAFQTEKTVSGLLLVQSISPVCSKAAEWMSFLTELMPLIWIIMQPVKAMV